MGKKLLDYCERSYCYSLSVKGELEDLLHTTFGTYYDSVCFIATGSLGKGQMTPGSDVDLICILDNKYENPNMLQDIIKKKLGEFGYKHAFEFYPIETLETWKWIARYSTLYCSDLFYGIILGGEHLLFQELMDWVSSHKIEFLNRQSHFTYNILYRNQQLQNPENERSLKYQGGGLRDFQFIKWVSRRIQKTTSYLPKDYLYPLRQSNMVEPKEYDLLVSYANVILGYKWEGDVKQEPSECQESYEAMRSTVGDLVERLKKISVGLLFKVGSYNADSVASGRPVLSLPLQLVHLNCECTILNEIWGLDNSQRLTEVLQQYGEFWSVRAALALNPNCPAEILKELMCLNYPDMDDIVEFVLRNPNYEC